MPPRRRIPRLLKPWSGVWKSSHGNPSAIYREGRDAKTALEEARRTLANLLGTTARRLIFTGGGSEANNMVLKGMALAGLPGKNHLITSTIEHPSVLASLLLARE